MANGNKEDQTNWARKLSGRSAEWLFLGLKDCITVDSLIILLQVDQSMPNGVSHCF
jgi:hypothetical protein